MLKIAQSSRADSYMTWWVEALSSKDQFPEKKIVGHVPLENLTQKFMIPQLNVSRGVRAKKKV